MTTAPTGVITSHSPQVWAIWKLILTYREVLPLGYTDADDHRRHKNGWLRPFLHMLDRAHQIRHRQQQEKKLRIWERRAARLRELATNARAANRIVPTAGEASSEHGSLNGPLTTTNEPVPQRRGSTNGGTTTLWERVSGVDKTRFMSYFSGSASSRSGSDRPNNTNAADLISPYHANDHDATTGGGANGAHYESVFSAFGFSLMLHNGLIVFLSIRPIYLQEMALQALFMVIAGCLLFLHWILYNIEPWMTVLVAGVVLLVIALVKLWQCYIDWRERAMKRRQLQSSKVHTIDTSSGASSALHNPARRHSLQIKSVQKAPTPAENALVFEPKPVIDKHEKYDNFDVPSSGGSSRSSISDSSVSSSDEDDEDDIHSADAGEIFGVTAAVDAPTRYAHEQPQYFRTLSERRHEAALDELFSDDGNDLDDIDDEGKSSLDFDLLQSPQRDFELGPPSPDYAVNATLWKKERPSPVASASSRKQSQQPQWIVDEDYESGRDPASIASSRSKILSYPSSRRMMANTAARSSASDDVDDIRGGDDDDDDRMADFSAKSEALRVSSRRTLFPASNASPQRGSVLVDVDSDDASPSPSASPLKMLPRTKSMLRHSVSDLSMQDKSPSSPQRKVQSFSLAVESSPSAGALPPSVVGGGEASPAVARREEIVRSIAAAQGNVAALGLHLQTTTVSPQRARPEAFAAPSDAATAAPKRRVSIGPVYTEDGRALPANASATSLSAAAASAAAAVDGGGLAAAKGHGTSSTASLHGGSSISNTAMQLRLDLSTTRK